MGKAPLLEHAQNIALEVAAYRPDYNEQRQSIVEELHRDSTLHGLESTTNICRSVGYLVADAFNYSHQVVSQADGYIAANGKTTVFTRRTLAMTAVADTLRPWFDTAMDDCCNASELSFVHGLEFHASGRRPYPDHAAAIILHDIADEPLAYQKAVGRPLAYVWRDGVVQTSAGCRQLFAGTIVRFMHEGYYYTESALGERFAGAGLAGVGGCVADEVEFKRLSIEFLPKRIRAAVLVDATSAEDGYGDYGHHITQACTMNSSTFADRVAEAVQTMRCYEYL